MRQTLKEIEVNIAYRWFIGYDLTEPIPHFSTFGKNYKRRFEGTDIVERIFRHILEEAVKCGFVDAKAIFIDGTHIRANANKNKKVKELVAVEAKRYQKELDEEIAPNRKEHGKKPLRDKADESDDEGEDHEIAKKIIDDKRTPSMPCKCPMTPEGYFKKYEYVYDEYFDCYICPNNQVLKYSTTDCEGYREYKSDPETCKNCPCREKCTKSKGCQKTVTRHVWESYLETVEDCRHTPWIKDLYDKRKQKIERVFADAKVKHGLRYTQMRGLAKVTMQVTLTVARMNLKKLAKWKRQLPSVRPCFDVWGYLVYFFLPHRKASIPGP